MYRLTLLTLLACLMWGCPMPEGDADPDPIDIATDAGDGSDASGDASADASQPGYDAEFRANIIIEPDEAPMAGGTTTVIEGEDFTDDIEVYFGDKLATTISSSPTELVVETPAGSIKGWVDMRLVRSDVEKTYEDALYYVNRDSFDAASLGMSLSVTVVADDGGPIEGAYVEVIGVGFARTDSTGSAVVSGTGGSTTADVFVAAPGRVPKVLYGVDRQSMTIALNKGEEIIRPSASRGRGAFIRPTLTGLENLPPQPEGTTREVTLNSSVQSFTGPFPPFRFRATSIDDFSAFDYESLAGLITMVAVVGYKDSRGTFYPEYFAAVPDLLLEPNTLTEVTFHLDAPVTGNGEYLLTTESRIQFPPATPLGWRIGGVYVDFGKSGVVKFREGGVREGDPRPFGVPELVGSLAGARAGADVSFRSGRDDSFPFSQAYDSFDDFQNMEVRALSPPIMLADTMTFAPGTPLDLDFSGSTSTGMHTAYLFSGSAIVMTLHMPGDRTELALPALDTLGMQPEPRTLFSYPSPASVSILLYGQRDTDGEGWDLLSGPFNPNYGIQVPF